MTLLVSQGGRGEGGEGRRTIIHHRKKAKCRLHSVLPKRTGSGDNLTDGQGRGGAKSYYYRHLAHCMKAIFCFMVSYSGGHVTFKK